MYEEKMALNFINSEENCLLTRIKFFLTGNPCTVWTFRHLKCLPLNFTSELVCTCTSSETDNSCLDNSSEMQSLEYTHGHLHIYT